MSIASYAAKANRSSKGMRLQTGRQLFPGLAIGAGVCAVAWATALIWREAFRLWMDIPTATAIGMILGPGLVGWIAASQAGVLRRDRLGLRGLEPRFVLPVVLLIPSIFLGMELLATIRRLAGNRPIIPALDWNPWIIWVRSPDDPIATGLLAFLAAPLALEWLFRGIVQPGLVDRHGTARGVIFTAALAALFQIGHRPSAAMVAAVALSAFAWNLLLGCVRQASGSLLASLLVHAGGNFVWYAVAMLASAAPIRGLTATGGPAPAPLLAGSAIAVALAVVLLARASRRRAGAASGDLA